MIARVFIFILLAIVLPDIYVYARYLRRRADMLLWQRLLWWLPEAVLAAYTIGLALIRDFAPADMTWLNVYLFMLGLVAVPKLLFVTCSAVGLLARRVSGARRNWGNYVGVALSVGAMYMLVYGSVVGIRKFAVRHVDLYFDKLPEAFDGYRLVQFTDVHAGSVDPQLLEHVVSTINSLDADAVVFTGDLQNMQPGELDGYDALLGSVRGRDGVYSVLGNHDYSIYVNSGPEEKSANERKLINRERGYGWTLLLNSHKVLRRGADSIVIAGEENGGKLPCSRKTDIRKTLEGVSAEAFVVLLQHDPSSWRKRILPESSADLTLSGHTHGGQVSLFGFSPMDLLGKESGGLYGDGARALYVSTGVGGLVPFRFGVAPEVVVLTLRKQTQKTNRK